MTGARGSPREQNPAYRACTYGDAAKKRHPLFRAATATGRTAGAGAVPGEAEKPGKEKRRRTGIPCGRHRQHGIFFDVSPADGDPRRTYPAKQRLQMVDPGHDHARDVHGRAGRDGSQRRAAGHHVGFRHRHLDGRMGHHRLHDHHDRHAPLGGLVRRPLREQTHLYSGAGALHARVVALRQSPGRPVSDRGTRPARRRQRHHPVTGTGDRDPRIPPRAARPGARPVGNGGGRLDLVRSPAGRLSGRRIQLAQNLRRERPRGSVRHPALGLYPERMEKPGAAPVRLAGIRGHRALHAAGDLRAGAGQLADQPRRLG